MRPGTLRGFEQWSMVHVFADFHCSEAMEAWRNCRGEVFLRLEFSYTTFYQKMNHFPRRPAFAFLNHYKNLIG